MTREAFRNVLIILAILGSHLKKRQTTVTIFEILGFNFPLIECSPLEPEPIHF